MGLAMAARWMSEFDHVVVLSENMEEARRAYDRMGFCLTTSDEANTELRFRAGHLLVSGEEGRGERAPPFQRGLYSVGLAGPDVASVAEAARESGLALAPSEATEQAALAQGSSQIAVRLFESHDFVCACQITRRRTKVGYNITDHPNSAALIRLVQIPMSDVAAASNFLRALWGANNLEEGRDATSLVCGQTIVEFVKRSNWGDSLSKGRIIIQSLNLNSVRRCLGVNGVRFDDQGMILRVPPSAANGVTVEFHEE